MTEAGTSGRRRADVPWDDDAASVPAFMMVASRDRSSDGTVTVACRGHARPGGGRFFTGGG